MEPIEGKQVKLRDIRLDELDLLEHYWRPGHKWQETDGPYGDPPSEEAGIEWAAKRIAAVRKRVEKGDFSDPRTRMVIADRDDDRLIGNVSWYWRNKETLWASGGISIYDDSVWGRGLGTEAFGLWTDYQFKSHPEWVRFGFDTWSGNTGMIGIGRKLGFTEEARFRKAALVRGEYFDSVGFGVLREEWATIR